MRSGRHRLQPHGWTYLLLLLALALGAAMLATLGQAWQTLAQRDAEAELLFRGGAIAQALADWRDATPAGLPNAPSSLEELLLDQRRGSDAARPLLRRLYTDPFTGQADWVLQRDAAGGIQAVSSSSRRPALRRSGLQLRSNADPRNPAVGDWLFQAPQPRRATSEKTRS